MTTHADAARDEERHALRREILARWNKFTAEDVMALASFADLADQLEAKYGMTSIQAQRVVEAFAKGRQL